MQASGLLMVSPDRTVSGQELNSCVASILSKKLGWTETETSDAAIELEWAFKELGIEDELSFAYFDDHTFWTPPNGEQLKDLCLLKTCFSSLVKAMICKIAKALNKAQSESIECFLGPTATIESLLKWIDTMQNPRMNDTGSSSGQSSGGGNGGSGPKDGSRLSESRKVEDIKIKAFKGEVFVNGDKFLDHIRDQFNKQAVGDYLLDESVCNKDPSRSLAFLTHLRESVADHNELGRLTATSKNEKSCAKFFAELTKVLENRETKLGRECHLVNKLMELSCDDLDSFGAYYSSVTVVIQQLEEDNPTLVSNDSFLRVFFHNRIHVEDLKLLTTKLLNDFASSARSILLEMNQVYSSYKVSTHMRQQNPGQTAGILKKVRKTLTSPNKVAGQDGNKPIYFPKNFNSAMPEEVYKQIKEWHAVAAKYPKSDTDTTFLKEWKYKHPKPPGKGKGGQGGYQAKKDWNNGKKTWKSDQEWNDLKKDLRRETTKNARMTKKLHDREKSTSRSRSQERDRDRNARRSRYRSPSPPHRSRSTDRGGNHRARHSTRRDQFFTAHNSAAEYRKDSERKRSNPGR